MEIRFGAPLIARGDAHIGAIQRIVLDAETQRLRALTVRTGYLFPRERVVGAGYVREHPGGQGVAVDLDAADIALLPLLEATDFVEPAGDRDHVHPYAPWTGGETSMASFIGGGSAVNRRARPVFDVPQADSDVMLIDAHAIVHGSQGRRVGSVAGVVCEDGTVVGLLIKQPGIFRGGEIYVPTDFATYSGDTGGALGLEWRE